jgi:hypothetical protein
LQFLTLFDWTADLYQPLPLLLLQVLAVLWVEQR